MACVSLPGCGACALPPASVEREHTTSLSRVCTIAEIHRDCNAPGFRSPQGDAAPGALRSSARQPRSGPIMRLHIGGLGLRGDGYPNAARTVALLRQSKAFEVVECGSWLPEDFHLWK